MTNVSQHIDGFQLVEFFGRLDTTNADELDTELRRLVSKGCKSILVDLSGLDYISSYGIRAFVPLIKAKLNIAVVVKSDSVYSIFEMAGLINALKIKRDFKEAIKELHK